MHRGPLPSDDFAFTSHTLTVLSMDAVAIIPGMRELKLIPEVVCSCAWKVKLIALFLPFSLSVEPALLAQLRTSMHTIAPSSSAQYKWNGLNGSQVSDSISAVNEQAEVVVAVRASIKPIVLSNAPVANSHASVGCQITLCTLSVWWVNVCEHAWVVTSQIFTVVSADPLARAWRYVLFQLRPITAASCEPGRNADTLFLFFLLFLFSSGFSPPRMAVGSKGSSTSKFQISIAGLNVPTAI
mmetsp:Transcript_1015/g.1664  ORF Transcript_1015/g.1664 Transcript_1015/m.1664 type:complete len:241 (-) Transcript_1015:665-1387(-)